MPLFKKKIPNGVPSIAPLVVPFKNDDFQVIL